ncbi:hypothetical protein TNIN_444551 [Trichonephila inaurata madagascariensis]|uniref:Uncharacterized protein n=1 Tax=Trichonephila inaurata madagascariensis TaxID=2747483 RepID=A0A8X7CK08_9ARAC|nr:hypothetical protein TNIN_444551 [Trichonephila inaurata madagascariensis]
MTRWNVNRPSLLYGLLSLGWPRTAKQFFNSFTSRTCVRATLIELKVGNEILQNDGGAAACLCRRFSHWVRQVVGRVIKANNFEVIPFFQTSMHIASSFSWLPHE